MENGMITLPNKLIYNNLYIDPKERDLPYKELIELWSSYEELAELLYYSWR